MRRVSPTPARRRIDAVVVGASAGGVDALMTVLPALKRGFALPVFVVLHVPRHMPSALVEIFAPRCALAVREVEDKQPVADATIYFAPPDYHLLIDAGEGVRRPVHDVTPCLALSADETVNYSRPSIDVLFESAADFYGERLAGIILTGANSDGAAGLAAVARGGGITIVQQPEGAFASAMPAAAMARVTPDFVLPLADIAGRLHSLSTLDPLSS
jgi:two-component system chemotaxis response regulator CheB